jgi:hypothetical protein
MIMSRIFSNAEPGLQLTWTAMISDRKVNEYKGQLKRGLKIGGIDWEVDFKLLIAELRGKVQTVKDSNTLFQDLKRVIDELDNNHSIGTIADLDNFDYPWIRMSDEFLYEVMSSPNTHPHFRWRYLKDDGQEKRIIYLVGSLAYGLPRTSTWREPKDLYRHFDLCLDDLDAHNFDDAARNLANEVLDYTSGQLGIASLLSKLAEDPAQRC